VETVFEKVFKSFQGKTIIWLVAEPTQLEKYARQNGFIFLNFWDENKKYLKFHHPEYLCSNKSSCGIWKTSASYFEQILHQLRCRKTPS